MDPVTPPTPAVEAAAAAIHEIVSAWDDHPHQTATLARAALSAVEAAGYVIARTPLGGAERAAEPSGAAPESHRAREDATEAPGAAERPETAGTPESGGTHGALGAGMPPGGPQIHAEPRTPPPATPAPPDDASETPGGAETRETIRDRMAAALAAKFTWPAFKHDTGRYPGTTAPDPADLTGNHMRAFFTDTDGRPGFRPVTCEEAAEVCAAVRDALTEFIGDGDDQPEANPRTVHKAELLTLLHAINQHAQQAAGNLRASTGGWDAFPDDAPIPIDDAVMTRLKGHAETLDRMAEDLFNTLAEVYRERMTPNPDTQPEAGRA